MLNRLSDFPFTAFMGIDWGNDKHYICLQLADGTKEFDCIEHTAEAIEAWAQTMQQRFGDRIGIALELKRGPLVSALQKYNMFTLFPINPAALAKYRETWHPSHAKDDPTDAELALEMVLKHPERFTALKQQSEQMQELLYLVEQRRRFIDDQVRYVNRLTSTLKQYYPQALEWFGLHNTLLFCAFLARWPTLLQATRARRSTLKRFFDDHGSRRKELVTARIEAIKTAMPLTEDAAIINAHSRQTLVLIQQLQITIEAVKQYDQAIAKRSATHPDYFIYEKLPGAGNTIAPRLLTAMGEDRDRFASAADVQKCVAIAPVKEQSGQQCWVHWRRGGSTFLRQTFMEWAAHSRHYSFWAGEYYRRQRDKGKSHNVAVRALAFKWIRILYRCWKDRTAYDEAKYLRALQQRGSPLVPQIT